MLRNGQAPAGCPPSKLHHQSVPYGVCTALYGGLPESFTKGVFLSFVGGAVAVQACLRLTEEQRAKLVAVTARFQQQRSMLLQQRQGIYSRLQRPCEHSSVSEEAIDEFLKV